MPSDPPKTGTFTPHDIFSIAGRITLSGVLKTGILQKNMTSDVSGLHLIITQVEPPSGSNYGITVSGLDIPQAQELIGKDLKFS